MGKRQIQSITVICLLFLGLGAIVVQAKTILYVPQDNRPVSLSYVTDTAQAAGFEVITPPLELIAGRDKKGDPEKLWQWVMDHGVEADAMVLSSDSLVYGGLVDSRKHAFAATVLEQRVKRFDALQQAFPAARLYVYGTVLRTPRASSGGVDAPYYEKYGPQIFQLTALGDKQETDKLTRRERRLLQQATASVPPAALEDWMARRRKNFAVNTTLIELTRQGRLNFFLLGRDDTAVYSQSHKEGRELAKQAADLSPVVFQTFPGADQLGMIMLTRAYNDLMLKIPIVQLQYAPGAGADSIPSYEDEPIGKSIVGHVIAAGGVVFAKPVHPDLVLAVNTSRTGKTLEAESPRNTAAATPVVRQFADGVQTQLTAGKTVAVADVAYGNGADNALLAELEQRGMLDRLAAYSGWNTAGNTVGYAIGQAILSQAMSDTDRKRVLAVRYLDDWAYQANLRRRLDETIIYPRGGSLVDLKDLKPVLTAQAQKQEQLFATQHLPWIKPEDIDVSFPWNRMFELEVAIAPGHTR